jgi:hypothetical protein
MKFYIPELGDQIKLLEDWTFDLYLERRNQTLLKKLGWMPAHRYDAYIDPISGKEIDPWARDPVTHDRLNVNPKTTHILPEGTILKIDRIYIRAGQEDFSSITFRIPLQKIRFWAKLKDVNQIKYEKI